MNPIKKLFNKINTERKFKEAGPGHKLNEVSNRDHPTPSSSSKGRPSQHISSEEARRAGQAALARVEQRQSSQSTVNWSLKATKAQARKEMELENAAKAKAEAKSKKEVVKTDHSILAVSGVYFKCPLLGPEILPRNEMEERIKTFLYEQYEEEKGLTACLIIHTLSRNKEKLGVAIETLSRYLTNILDNPEEEKYRKIRLNNKVFQERIVGIEGAFEFLSAAGFSKQVIDHEEYLVFSRSHESDFENMQMLKEALLSAEPILPCLDRNLRILRPAQVAGEINLPEEFFHLSAEELKREQETKAETVELMTQLRTKAMRERDEIREFHRYKFALIRIRFPDDIFMQGTFYVHEKLQAVKEFVAEYLRDPSKSFQILLPGGLKLTDNSLSLLELKLVPAAVLNLLWENGSGEDNGSYLKPEIVALLSDV
ncbi:UBX domain-containing protein 6 [Parasteatoda tepidariorum]|uniref:UBX domain-containing protein 6 n=1 Tax=Parasteatoda tepidariorum TaxID=114398 RepID=UPI001C722094|nr:UBX domain-containing protein 6 [Parasteatoda tepidariorum]